MTQQEMLLLGLMLDYCQLLLLMVIPVLLILLPVPTAPEHYSQLCLNYRCFPYCCRFYCLFCYCCWEYFFTLYLSLTTPSTLSFYIGGYVI